MSRRLQARLEAADGEAGFTMIEMIITISILTIFMGLFTGAVLAITDATQKQQSLADATDQINKAFNRLDTEVRYASLATTPGQVGLDWYVEIYDQNTTVPTCTQLRLQNSTHLLQQRTWASTGAAATPSGWITLAARISNNPTTQIPFTTIQVGGTSPYTKQQLQISLLAVPQQHGRATTAVSNVTFTVSNYTDVLYANYVKAPTQCSSAEVTRS